MLYNFESTVFSLNLSNSEFNSIKNVAWKKAKDNAFGFETIELQSAELEELTDYFAYKLAYQTLTENVYIIVNNLLVFQLTLNESDEIEKINVQIAAFYGIELHKMSKENKELVLINNYTEDFKEDFYKLIDICETESKHNEKVGNDIGFMDGNIKAKLKDLIEKYYNDSYKKVFDDTEKTIIINGFYVFRLVEKQQHMWYGTTEIIAI